MYETLQLTLAALILLALIYAAIVAFALSRADQKDIPEVLKEANRIFVGLVERLPGVRIQPMDGGKTTPALDQGTATNAREVAPQVEQTENGETADRASSIEDNPEGVQ